MPLLMCPNCKAEMREIRRHDVLIDMCTECRGVWFDHGELEKMLRIAREEAEILRHAEPEPKRERYRSLDDSWDESWDESGDDWDERRYKEHKKKKKKYKKKKKKVKSAFEEIFDIFD